MTGTLARDVDTIETTLHVEGQEDGSLTVLGVEGEDLLSGVARYRVRVVSSAEVSAKLDDALGREAVLSIQRADESDSLHVVRGIIQEVFPEGVNVGKDQRRTQLLLEPTLGELLHKKSSCVYQDKTVVEIAESLLHLWHIELDARLHPAPKKREFCTQVNEPDLAFLARILAEEGIHFHVDHTKDKSTLVLVNDPVGYEPIAGAQDLPFRDADGAVTTDHVKSIQRENRIRPGSAAYRDFNWIVPSTEMTARTESAAPQAAASLGLRELYEYPGIFNHPDAEAVGFQPDVQWPTRTGVERTKLRLEEQRSDALTFSGTSNCLRLRVGRTFTIADHADKPFNKSFIITSIKVQAVTESIPILAAGKTVRSKHDAELVVRFTAVAADVPIRPRVLPKPPAPVRIARVVGPKIDEPYVDSYGRIKIQFAWDREGQSDEKSSCWVRMMTPSAHHNQGTYIAHRVGAEVVVDFLDGDVDRPIVIGALFNGELRQPQKLPDDATRAVLYRGLSVPGNKGNNELSIEDRAGKEEILVHAQRDLNAHVNRNHSESIGANQSTSVGAAQSVSVGANQSISVKGKRTVDVKGDEEIHIVNSRHERVDDGESVTIKGGRKHTITTAHDSLDVSAGGRWVSVSESHNLTAKSKVEDVATTIDVNAGTSITLHHKGDSSLFLSAAYAEVAAKGAAQLGTPQATVLADGGKLSLHAAEEITLTCGAASLSMKADGTIVITGSKQVAMACKSSKVTLEPPKATFAGANAEVSAVAQMTVGGALIKIG